MQVSIDVKCVGVRGSDKDSSLYYANFETFGASFNVRVSPQQANELKLMSKVFKAVFALKAMQIVNFNRPQTVLSIDSLLSFEK